MVDKETLEAQSKALAVNLKAILTLRGGAGSGNWGHVGRQGKRGGSGGGGGLKAIGAKVGSSHQERLSASRETKQVRQWVKNPAALERLSSTELLTLRGRIDSILNQSQAANTRLGQENPIPGGAKGHVTQVYGADPKTRYDMQYEVVELNSLVTSNLPGGAVNPNFPQELQPRDRSRAASQTQIDSIARKMEPDALLDEFKAIDRGTMIIGADNVVESGNGRTMALQRAKELYPEQYAKYQNRLKEMAAERGIDPAALDQFENPVLVRRRLTDVDRAKFAQDANTAQILGASDVERGRQDARRISSEALQNLTPRDTIDDTIRAAANRDFVRDFIAKTPETERAVMMDRQGNLTRTGENRVKAAMFNRVYDSPTLADTIFESPDSNLKNVTNGLMNALGPMSKAEELVRAGQRSKDLSIAGDIVKTVEKYSALRQTGMSVDNFLAQGGLFGRELTPVQERLLVEVDRRSRSGKKVKEFFDLWPSLVEAEPHPNQGTLFGPAGRSKDELIEAWIKQGAYSQ